MKRIEDLKENECIEIRNKKEALKVQKLIKNNFVFINGGDYTFPFCYYPHEKVIRHLEGVLPKEIKKTINKASDFIPKKKSLKKRVKELEKKVNDLQLYIDVLNNKYKVIGVNGKIEIIGRGVTDDLV